MLTAQLAADPAAARRAVSTRLRQLPAGGPASIALGEIELEVEQHGMPRTRCEGVPVLYRWRSGLERPHDSGAQEQVEQSALAVGKALSRLGLEVRGSAGQETAGIPWSRIAPIDADPLDPRGARAVQSAEAQPRSSWV